MSILSGRGRARVACACAGVAAGLLILTPGSVAAPAPDPACDFPAQAAANYRPTGDESPSRQTSGGPGTTVCEHTTGAQGMEPMLAVNRRGTLFMGIATDKGLYEQPGRLNGTSDNALLRSRDDGRTWQRIPLPGVIDASEGFPYIDPATDRLFVTSFSFDQTRCGQPVVHSDDEGATWSAAAAPPGCSPPTRGDWPKIFSGPFKGRPPGRYPTAVYECNFIPNDLVAASIGCWRSDDGGDHFEFTGLLPTINGLCRAGDVQGGTGATIVHGSGRVLSNGDVVVPLTVCGKPAVVLSTDEGRTWQGIATGGRSLGLEDVIALKEGFVLAVTDHVWSENLAVDDHDNLYFAYVRDGVHLMVSRDGGRSWRHLGIVTPPGIVHAIVASVTARGRGEVALTYYATPDRGDALGASGMNWRAWMTYSPNALAADPEFRSAPTSPESAPTMSASMPGCCTTDETFLEYTGVKFVSPTEIRGAFTRWTGKHLPELVLTKLRLPRPPATCRPIVLHIPRALRRLQVTANGRRLRVRGRRNHRYVIVDRRRYGSRRTVVVRVSGIDRRGHVRRRIHRYHGC